MNCADPQSDKTQGERLVQDAWKLDEDLRKIAPNGGILVLLCKLHGGGAFLFQTLNFPRGDAEGRKQRFGALF